MEYLIVAVIAFWVGWKLSAGLQRMTFGHILKELGVKEGDLEKIKRRHMIIDDEEPAPEEEPYLEEIEVKIEQHQGQLYAFRLDNDQFIGQGATREDLVKRIAEQMSDVKLIIREENGAALMKT